MSDTLESLRIVYTELGGKVLDIDEATSWSPTACAGWTVRDLVYHLLGDAQRALVAVLTRADGPADRDAVSYWSDFAGATGDPESRELRSIRMMASAWRLPALTNTYAETTRAVVCAAESISPDALIRTQGHTLRVDDLLATLVVEAAVHQLDATPILGRPDAEPLAVVRATLDGLLGRPTPPDWATVRWALTATGRAVPSDGEVAFLGGDLARLPLFS